MNKSVFGYMPDGTAVEQYTLNSDGISCKILTYGGALRSLSVPDKDGNTVDVLLGFDSLEAYMQQDCYIGALVGRCANRIGGSSFELNGKTYNLYSNNGRNHLHGGKTGFDKQVWKVEDATDSMLVLSLFSPDGQEEYPGNLAVKVTYTLADNALTIDYWAQSDADTICNLTNHAYFNLSGHNSGTTEDTLIQINADYYTPTDSESIPTGEIVAVENTPMDLRTPLKTGLYADSDFAQLKLAGGYDHNWCINGTAGQLRFAASAKAEDTGIVMKTYTTQPGMQLYGGNFIQNIPAGKDGTEYVKRSGFCFETQNYPDAVHHSNFPSAVLKAGEIYSHRTVYKFETEK